MKPTDDAQRPTAGELMSDEELNPPAQGGASPDREEILELAREHRGAVAEGRKQVGEGDPNSGQNAQDHGGSIHPRGGEPDGG